MIKRFVLALVLVSVCFVAAPTPAKAFNPFGNDVCSGNNQSSAACQAQNTDPIAGTNPKCDTSKVIPTDCGILINVTRIIAYLAGAIAVIMIIVGALRYITSGSDVSTGSRTDTDVEEARRTIASALAGLVIIVLAQAIITYFVKRL